jgi:DNA-binding CsgD family transcriptional regulator
MAFWDYKIYSTLDSLLLTKIVTAKQDILIYSSFDSTFTTQLKYLKQEINADFMVTSRDFEIPFMLNSMSISVIIVNCRSMGFSDSVLQQIPVNSQVPLVFFNDKQPKVPERVLANTSVFTFDLNRDSDFRNIARNINAIVQLSLSQSGVASKQVKLRESTSMNEKNLCRYVMELEQKDKTLSEVKSRIDELCEAPDSRIRQGLQSISSSINVFSLKQYYWDDFKAYFEKVNPSFIMRLTQMHPNLTTKDIKYCCYLKMNMSNNDIKSILNINQESVRTHKYRLKRKLGLDRESSLRAYFHTILPAQIKVSI